MKDKCLEHLSIAVARVNTWKIVSMVGDRYVDNY